MKNSFRKRFLILARIVFLSIAYAVIRTIVYFRPSTQLVRLKIQLGAFILLLTGVVSCGHHQHTCYKPAVSGLNQETPDSRSVIEKDDSIQQTAGIKKELPDTSKYNQPPDCYMKIRNDDRF